MENKKKLFPFSTRTIVAIGLGGAIFTLLFMFVKVPSPIPETSFQTAMGIAGFFGALFGPIAGALIGFIGHAISDTIQYGSAWWSWVIATGISGFIYGISYKFLEVEKGIFKAKGIITFNVIQIVGNAIAWVLVAPVLDIVIYKEPVNLVFTQGLWAFVMNSVSCGVIATILLLVYSATRTKAGSLKKGA